MDNRVTPYLAGGVGALIGTALPHAYCLLALGASGLSMAHALGISPWVYLSQICTSAIP
jgi:hypothetical protein